MRRAKGVNASPESFVHKTLKDEQIEYIHRIAVLSISTDGRRKASATSLREVGYIFP